MEKIIQVEWLSKTWSNGCKAVDTISFDVLSGDIYGFLWHNWAGKTTTTNILTTLLEPSSWNAFIDGKSILHDAFEVKKIIGYLPENIELYTNFTVYENLEYFAKLSWIEHPRDKILETLHYLDVDYMDKKIGELSKGMKQRIGIAQAILHEPKVLFLDEPNTWLDPLWIKQLRDIIIKLNKEKGMTIFMDTHLLSEVWKLCNRVWILNQGKIIFSGTIDELRTRYPDENSLENIYLKIDGHD